MTRNLRIVGILLVAGCAFTVVLPRARKPVVELEPEPETELSLAKYRACLDVILSGGDGRELGCPMRNIPKRFLYVGVGDSTARRSVQAVNPRFPNFKASAGQNKNSTSVTDTFILRGKETSVSAVLHIALRHHNLQARFADDLRKITKQHGMEPTVVVFSGMGLHECHWPNVNSEPLWLEVMERRKSELGLDDPNSTLSQSEKRQVLAGARTLSINEYIRMQEPCTISLLKQLRLEYPRTLFVWRPVLKPAAYFKGSPLDASTEKMCKKLVNKWAAHKWPACTGSQEQHLRIAAEMRRWGFGVLDVKSVFPEHCKGLDGIHLGGDCNKMFANWTYEAARLPVPDPASYLRKDEVDKLHKVQCSVERKKKTIRKMRALTLAEVRSHSTKLRVTEHCAKLLNMTEAYDPLMDEYIPVGGKVPQ